MAMMTSCSKGMAAGRCGSGSQTFTLPLLLLVVAVGFLLRLHQIGADSLWIDEAFSIWLAEHPLDGMISWVRSVDHHPPLYYVLLHGWTSIFSVGEGGASMTVAARMTLSTRVLSALFGVLAIPVIYLLGRRMADERVGVISALILALSPFHVRFAQEARMYSLLTLFALLAMCAFVELYAQRVSGGSHVMDRSPFSRSAKGSGTSASPGAGRRSPLPWIGYVASMAAMLWTHNTALFFPIAANLVVLIDAWRRDRPLSSASADAATALGISRPGRAPWLRRWLVAQVAVLILWLPWFPSLVSQAADVYRRFWLPAPTLGKVLSIVGAFLWDSSPGPFLLTIVVDAGLIALALFGLRNLHRRFGYATLLGVVFVAPFVGQWIVSLWRPILSARTLSWASIPLYLMIAAGVSRLGENGPYHLLSRGATLAAVVALMGTSGAALSNYYATSERESWDDAAALVAERIQPDDLLLFNDAWGQIPFDYYFHQLYNPESGASVVEHGLPVDLFDRGVLEPQMTVQDLPRLRMLVDGRRRVWLVYSHQWYTDPDGLIPQALASTLDLHRRWMFRGLQVHLYARD